MAKLRQIAQLGAAVLRQQAREISDPTATEVQSLIADLQAALADSSGVGLAAPQIYESRRIVIVASRPTPRYPHAPEMAATTMINPSFQPLSTTQEKDWEGCLSIPGIRALVPRYTEIQVTFIDAAGNSMHLRLQGFPARVFQHEYDHLNGLVYLDRVENNRDIISEKEFLRQFARA